MNVFLNPISFSEPQRITLFERFFQLGNSYRIHRAMCEVRQMKIEDLMLTYRLQASGRAMAKFSTIRELRVWTNCEAGRALQDRHALRKTRKWMRVRLEETLAVLSPQRELIRLLEYITTTHKGADASPAEIYARLEDGKLRAETRRRIIEKRAEEDEEDTAPELQEPLQEPLPVQRLLEASISKDPDNFITTLVPAGDLGVQVDPAIAETWEREWTPD